MNDPATSATFLRALFGAQLPRGVSVCLWELSTRRTTILRALKDAAAYEGHADVYLHACGMLSRPRGRRPNAADAVLVPGAWVDVDVAADGLERRGRPATDLDMALGLVFSIREPTLLVHSGWGVHAYWCFEEPWVLGTEHERTAAKTFLRDWQHALRERAEFDLDATHDLARLMRLPGTVNAKLPGRPQVCRVISDDGPRHDLVDLQALVFGSAGPATQVSGKPVARVEFPERKWRALMEWDDNFRRLWDYHELPLNRPPSESERDMRLCVRAAYGVGADEAELAALIRARRKDAKGRREDYLARTARAAIEWVRAHPKEEEA